MCFSGGPGHIWIWISNFGQIPRRRNGEGIPIVGRLLRLTMLSLSFSFSSPNLSGTACRQKEAKANIRNDACGKRRSESAENWGVVLGRYRLQRIANWLFSAIFRQINRFLFRNWFFILLDSYSMNHDTWFAVFGILPSTTADDADVKRRKGRKPILAEAPLPASRQDTGCQYNIV